jgi:hypothetical protein
MTHYTVQAWCDRRFITVIDLDADTPQQALEGARAQTGQLLDAAEECDGNYPWDEFAVYDFHGEEVNRHMDRPARLRAHAEDLLKALARLLDAAGNLDAAIDGTTDQFDDERRELTVAMHAASAAIALVEGA